jgi:hypothetical protein
MHRDAPARGTLGAGSVTVSAGSVIVPSVGWEV